jgi:hypothetical protein
MKHQVYRPSETALNIDDREAIFDAINAGMKRRELADLYNVELFLIDSAYTMYKKFGYKMGRKKLLFKTKVVK